MFYGLGSKWFLEQFVNILMMEADDAGDVIVVNRFSPNLSVREILNTIAKKIVSALESKTNIEQARNFENREWTVP